MTSSVKTPPAVRNSRSLHPARPGPDPGVAHLRDGLLLFRRQVVEILVHGIARVDLVLDAVEAGHHHRRERQVGVAHAVREAHLDAGAFGLASCGMRMEAERFFAE
jgi:hypothetical protein